MARPQKMAKGGPIKQRRYEDGGDVANKPATPLEAGLGAQARRLSGIDSADANASGALDHAMQGMRMGIAGHSAMVSGAPLKAGDDAWDKFHSAGPVHLAGGGDPAEALDTSAPNDKATALYNAMTTIDSAMQYGRQMHGLPTDNQQGALPAAPRPPVQQAARGGPIHLADGGVPDVANPNAISDWNSSYTPSAMSTATAGAIPSGGGAPPAGGNTIRATPNGMQSAQGSGMYYGGFGTTYKRGGPVLPVHLEGGGDPVDAPDGIPSYDPTQDQQIGTGGPPPRDPTPSTLQQLRATPPPGAAPAPQPEATPQFDPNEGEGMAPDSNIQAYLSRQTAVSEPVWTKAHQAQEEKYAGESPAFINMQTVASLPGTEMQFNGVQYLAKQSDHEANTVRALIANSSGGERDMGKIAAGFEKMLSYNTDGSTVKVADAGNGLLKFNVTGGAGSNSAGRSNPASFTLNLDQQHDLANIGKAGQFDTIDHKGIIGTLSDLSKSEGTPVPTPKVPDKDVPKNDGTVAGRNTPSEHDLMDKRYPWISQGGKKLDYGEALRKGRLEPEQELAKASAGAEVKKQVAEIQSGSRKAGQVARSATELMKQQHIDQRAADALNQRDLTQQETVARNLSRDNTNNGRVNDAETTAVLHNALTRQARGQEPAAQGDESTAPAAGASPGTGQPAPSAPTAKTTGGRNPDGTAATGKYRLGETRTIPGKGTVTRQADGTWK